MDKRLIIFATHPIQYQVPIYQALAKKLNLLVIYCLEQTAKGQAEAGFGVEFEWDVPLLNGYDFKYIKNYSKTPSSSTYKGIIISKKEVREILEAFKPTHALVHGWFPKAMIQILDILEKKGNIKILSRGDSTLLMTTSPVKKIVKEFYIRWILRKIDTFLYVGKENRRFLSHYGVKENRLNPAYHCINTPLFESLYPGKVVPANDKIRIGFVGKFIDKKQPLILIKAVAGLKNKHQVVINFIGAGPLENEMKTLANRLKVEVRYLGFMNQTVLIKEGYPNIDCLVLPSAYNETWGLVVNEAMTFGIPCIVSNKVGCHSDLIVTDKTGYTFDFNSSTDLSKKIDKLLSSLKTTDFTANVKSKIRDFSLSSTVERYLKAIES